MNIAIYGYISNEKQDIEQVKKLILTLTYELEYVCIWEPLYKSLKPYFDKNIDFNLFRTRHDIKDKVDILLCLGGDGTMLDTLDLIIGTQISVLGVNLGHLGFLTSVGRNDIDTIAFNLKNNRFTIQKRQVLSISSKDNELINKNKRFVANELAFVCSNRGHILSLDMFANDQYLSTFVGDGVLITTPTGSTAYSLACSGPIIDPRTDCFCITPIAPHNLTFRPIVLPSDIRLSVKVNSSLNGCKTLADGTTIYDNTVGELIIEKSSLTWNLLHFEDYSFFNSLRQKLFWGKDTRNNNN